MSARRRASARPPRLRCNTENTTSPFVPTRLIASGLPPVPRNRAPPHRASARPPPLSTPPLAPTPPVQHCRHRLDWLCGKMRCGAVGRGKGLGEVVRGPGACPARALLEQALITSKTSAFQALASIPLHLALKGAAP